MWMWSRRSVLPRTSYLLCYVPRQLVGILFELSLSLGLSLMLRPTVSRPFCLGIKAPSWGLRPDFYYCQTVSNLLLWGALSDKRTGLPFTISAGPRQSSHSRVRVPWDSRPYFTVSDSRLPFSLFRTIHSSTVEIFDPASIRDLSSVQINTKCKVTDVEIARKRQVQARTIQIKLFQR
jgi:hypothetical protein